MQPELLDRPLAEVKLVDFVGKRSWLMFQIFDVESDWMYEPAATWPGIPAYQRFMKLMRGLLLVNDCAERSINDMKMWLGYARDGDARDRAVIVANHHRQLCNFRNLTQEQLNNLDDYY